MNLLFSCIGRRGYIADFFRSELQPSDRIIGTGNTRWTPGFLACDSAFVLPDIVDDGYLDAVLELCEREKIDAVISFSDVDVHRLAPASRAFLEVGTRLIMPSAEVVEIAFDKLRMHEYLSANGVATPRTSATVEGASTFDFPVYVKPRWGSGSRDIYLAFDEDQASAFFSCAPDMVIQERASGDEINIELCCDLEGRPVGISTWKKFQSRLGETEQAETFHDAAVTEFGFHLAELLGGVVGPVDVDVFWSDAGLTVLDINPRFGGGYPVSHLAGAGFPRLLVQMISGAVVEQNFSFQPGVVMMKGLTIMGGPIDAFFRDELGVEGDA